MFQLDPDRFLNELGRLFDKAKTKDTVTLTLKRSEHHINDPFMLSYSRPISIFCCADALVGLACSQPQATQVEESQAGAVHAISKFPFPKLYFNGLLWQLGLKAVPAQDALYKCLVRATDGKKKISTVVSILSSGSVQ